MGKCERIKNTVFPTSYSLLVDILIYVWILFLPFGLIENIGLILIPTAVSLAFSFLAIDRIAYYMQDPFDNLPSDTPMLALSRTIEINILQELEDKNIPEPILPDDGVLM
jgi:putative membrane protein